MTLKLQLERQLDRALAADLVQRIEGTALPLLPENCSASVPLDLSEQCRRGWSDCGSSRDAGC